MTADRPVAIAMSAAVLPALLVKTARTEGPMTSTPATAPMTYPVIISQPVRKPR